jgi:hypothetical protein
MISQKYVSLLGLSKIIRNNSKLTFVGFPDATSCFSHTSLPLISFHMDLAPVISRYHLVYPNGP